VITVQDWQLIRQRCLTENESMTEVARDTGHSRTTLRKCLGSDTPPRRVGEPTRVPELETYRAEIDELLKATPKITAARIQTILRGRHDNLCIKERAVRRYVAGRRIACTVKEVFIRQLYAAGDQTQYDFKEVAAIIDGTTVLLHLFSARLSYSRVWFGRCYQSEDQPALFDGIQRASEVFGGVTKDGVFDNAGTAVKKVLRGRQRVVNENFSAFIGAYATTMNYAAPRKGNEKGGVEGVHGYIEDNFFRPIPSYVSLSELNDALFSFSIDDRSTQKSNEKNVIGSFSEEQKALRRLPDVPPRTCIIEHVSVNKFAEVRHKTVRYSVPTEHVGKLATIEVYANTIRVVVAHECVAEHQRLFCKNASSLDPLHFLEALERKHRAVERAEVLTNERFPLPLRQLLQRMVEADRDTAGQRFTRVLRLMKTHTPAAVVAAVEEAERYGVLDPDAIALLLSQRTTKPLHPLDIACLPSEAQILPPPVSLDCYHLSLLMENV